MERRASQRYGLQLGISFCRVPGVKVGSAGEKELLWGETCNISTGGMYFTTPRSLALNDVLDFSLAFPGLAHRGDVCVTGRARVVRVAKASHPTSEPAGVAVVTDEYHILEPEGVA